MPARRRSTLSGVRRERDEIDTLHRSRLPVSLRPRSILPQQVAGIVPSCAQSCFETYVNQQYSGCYNNDGLDCLCTKYSSEGYTLGELAFTCLQQDCAPASQTEQQDMYRICSAQAGEVSATHSTLTLRATPTTTSGVMTTTVDVYVTSSASTPMSKASMGTTLRTSTVPSSSEAPAPTNRALPMTSANSTPTFTASISTATSTAAAIKGSTGFTSAQAVGVSVAAFGGLGLMMALIWICACLRRKKGKGISKSLRSKHDSYDFVDDAPPRFSPFNYAYADPRRPLGGFAGRGAELPDETKAKSQWYREQFPNRQSAEKLDALGMVGSRNISPESMKSNRSNETLRTISQLLPDKPGETPPRPSHDQFLRPASIKSPGTVFEEYRMSRPAGKHTPAQPMPPVPTHASLLRTRSAISGTQYASQEQDSLEDSTQLSLSLTMPRKASRAAMKIPSPITIAPPPVPKDDRVPRQDRTSRGSKAKSGTSSKSGGSLLDYYTSPEIDLSMNPLGSPLTPISLEPQRRVKPIPAAITVTKPKFPPRAVRRVSSAGSDTSFENTDPDEPTPPDEEDKQLSPVAEHSPIAAIRYPKVPRSSNQSIPRSPPMKLAPFKSPRRQKQQRDGAQDHRNTLPIHAHQAINDHPDYVTPERQVTSSPSLSGSTLAAERRGDSGAKKRLYIDTSHSRNGSHVRGQSKPDNSTATTPPRLSAKSTRQESPLKGYGRVTSSSSAGRAGHQGKTTPTSLLKPEMKDPGPRVMRYAMERRQGLASGREEPAVGA